VLWQAELGETGGAAVVCGGGIDLLHCVVVVRKAM